jgi:putative peptide zinc metalloprotease protein
MKRAPTLVLVLVSMALAACTGPMGSDGPQRPSAEEGPPSTAAGGTSPSVEATIEVASADELLRQPVIAGGKRNEVKAHNRSDNRARVRTNLDFNRIRGDTVSPVNIAHAESTCSDCQAIAVAVQINVYERGASMIVPRNVAVAVNEDCLRCSSFARAIQYVIPVDNVDDVPREVEELVRAINAEARYFEKLDDLTTVDPAEAQARLDSIMARFAMLDEYLTIATEERSSEEPSASPTAAVSPSSQPNEAVGTPTPEPAPTLVPVPATPGAGGSPTADPE